MQKATVIVSWKVQRQIQEGIPLCTVEWNNPGGGMRTTYRLKAVIFVEYHHEDERAPAVEAKQARMHNVAVNKSIHLTF